MSELRPLAVAVFAGHLIDLPEQNALRAYVASGEVFERFVEELRLQSEDTPVVPLRAGSASHLLALVKEHPTGLAVVDVSQLTRDDWARLDLHRSQLARKAPTVWLLQKSNLEDLQQTAPNLASWLGETVQHQPESLDDTWRQRRLATLRAWAGRTDEEVCQAAESRTLPRDPEYAEWLVLLGRGDLLDA